MPIELRPVEPDDVAEVVSLALRAWEPVHQSMALVLGTRLNARVYPDWASSQAKDVTEACNDPATVVSVAVDGDQILAVVSTGGDDGHAPARALYESEGFTQLPLARYYRKL